MPKFVKHISCNDHASTYGDSGHAKSLDKPIGLPAGTYTMSYDYPLSRTATFTHDILPTTTGHDILVMGRADYEAIYKAEDEALADGKQPQAPYGIWGHDFGDLYFEGIDFDVEKKAITFQMGS